MSFWVIKHFTHDMCSNVEIVFFIDGCWTRVSRVRDPNQLLYNGSHLVHSLILQSFTRNNNIDILHKHQRTTEDDSNTLSFSRFSNFKGFYWWHIYSWCMMYLVFPLSLKIMLGEFNQCKVLHQYYKHNIDYVLIVHYLTPSLGL